MSPNAKQTRLDGDHNIPAGSESRDGIVDDESPERRRTAARDRPRNEQESETRGKTRFVIRNYAFKALGLAASYIS